MEDPAYYGTVGRLVRLIEPHTEADPASLLLQLLVALGNIIGRGAYVMADGAQHFFNLFVALVGDSSKGRKGSSWKQVLKVVKHVDPTFKGRIKSGSVSGEGIIHHIRDPLKGQVSSNDSKGSPITREVIKDRGVEDKRMCIVETELTKVLKPMNRDGNTMSDVFRQAWDSDNLQTLAKNSHNIATEPHVSFISHSTVQDLNKHLKATDMANGFANRILWVWVERSKLLPEGSDLHDAALLPWVEDLQMAIHFAKNAGELKRDDDARVLWRTDYEQLSSGRPGLVGAATSRAEAQVLRLSGLFAVLDRSPLIGVRHHLAAMAVWRYCELSARIVFGNCTGNKKADKILAALRSAGPLGLSKTDIASNVFSRNVAAHDIHEALVSLVEIGAAKFLPGRDGSVDRWNHATG